MSTFYVDWFEGDNDNAGTSWASPLKSFCKGDGVKYKVAKTPDPVDTGLTGTFSPATDLFTISDPNVTKLIQAAESAADQSAWTLGTGVNNSRSTLYKRWKSGSIGFNITTGSSAQTKIAHLPLASTLDLSAYTKISCWYAAGSLARWNNDGFSICLCSDTDGDVIINQLFFNDIGVTNRCTSAVLDNGSALGSNINSIAIYRTSYGGAVRIYFNCIFACNDIHLQSLICPEEDPDPMTEHHWFGLEGIENDVGSISGGNSRGNLQGRFGDDEGTYPLATRQLSGTITAANMDSTTSNIEQEIEGGYNKDTDIIDGISIFDSATSGTMIFGTSNGNGFTKMTNVGAYNLTGIVNSTNSSGQGTGQYKNVFLTGCASPLNSNLFCNKQFTHVHGIYQIEDVSVLYSDMTLNWNVGSSKNVTIRGIPAGTPRVNLYDTLCGVNESWRFVRNYCTVNLMVESSCMNVYLKDFVFEHHTANEPFVNYGHEIYLINANEGLNVRNFGVLRIINNSSYNIGVPYNYKYFSWINTELGTYGGGLSPRWKLGHSFGFDPDLKRVSTSKGTTLYNISSANNIYESYQIQPTPEEFLRSNDHMAFKIFEMYFNEEETKLIGIWLHFHSTHSSPVMNTHAGIVVTQNGMFVNDDLMWDIASFYEVNQWKLFTFGVQVPVSGVYEINIKAMGVSVHTPNTIRIDQIVL